MTTDVPRPPLDGGSRAGEIAPFPDPSQAMIQSPLPGDGQASPGDTLELGRAYSEWFAAGDLHRLWRRLSPELRESFSGLDGLREFRDQVREAGTERAVLDERVTRWLGIDVYSRTAEYSQAGSPILQQWMLDGAGVAAAFLVEPATEPAPSRFLDYETRTPLRLPVDGEWFVFWGGRHPVDNLHAAAPDQRFACDFLIVRGMHTHSFDPPVQNERFYCFGQPVLAPGDGRVIARESGIADNVPGSLDAANPLGNHVVIDHGNDEFSFLAHLQRDSVVVQTGDRVRAGEAIARCGNSGASSEPHLHYHLQNGPAFGVGAGLPAQFLRYEADGEMVQRGEPSRGQFIRAV